MSDQRLYAFEKLVVYHDAREYVKFVYCITTEFPNHEQYGLIGQLRRASISVVSNIAEGVTRSTDKEKVRFVEIAYGSLIETYSQFQIAQDLNYISEEQIKEIKLQIDKIGNKLGAFKRALNNNDKQSTINNPQ